MMTLMRIGSTMWRRLAVGTIPAAFFAALPIVQWCPLSAEVTLRDCLAGGAWPTAAAAPSTPVCPGGHGDCAAREAAGSCPFAHDVPRALCIGGAMGGPGLRPLSPELHGPELQPALPATEPRDIGLWGPRREPRRAVVQADARPPTRSWARRPPVRGPPLA
jgi:hypothetical protein